VTLFEEAGYVALTPGWPDDPETVAEAREHPEVFAVRNQSRTTPAKFAVFLVKDKGAPMLTPVE
jgi:hypothetical protein